MAGDGITKITLKSGAIRYRMVVDGGRDETGKRLQIVRVFERQRDARNERDRIRHERRKGTYVKPSTRTLGELCDAYLAEAGDDIEAGTASNYRAALLPVRRRLGDRPAQELDEEHVRAFVAWMLAHGRRRGGQVGGPLSARTVSLTLTRLRAVLDLGVRRQMLVRNVAERVKVPRAAKAADRERQAARARWKHQDATRFLASTSDNRLCGALLLSALGLRPAEVCGLTWADIDLEADTPIIRVNQTRTLVDGKVVTKSTKTAAGKRTLPLPDAVVTALKATRRHQASERLAAGPAYGASGHLLCDELGAPLDPAKYRRRLRSLMTAAEVPVVRPYELRHTCLSYLANVLQVPPAVLGAWAGHTDPSFTLSVYVHAEEDQLVSAAEGLNAMLGASLSG